MAATVDYVEFVMDSIGNFVDIEVYSLLKNEYNSANRQ